MASETTLNNTNLPNNSSFWQLNSDCLNYNQNILQIKGPNSQNIYPTYQTIPTGSNFNASNFNAGTKNVFYYPSYNSEIQESTFEDFERLKSYHYPQSYSIQSKNLATSTCFANNQIKPLFNPIYQNNFYEPKENQSGYINTYGFSNEIYFNQQTNEQKWPLIPISDSSHYTVGNFQNLTTDSINAEVKQPEKNENNQEFYFSESSQDSSNQSVKNESLSNGTKTDLVQVKSQSSNQKKTRTKDKYRVVYNDLQRSELEKEFNFSKYITSRRKSELAGKLDLSQRQIKIWFQNRRAKDRKMSKKKKSEHNSNESIANSISRLAIQNNETSHSFQISGLNNFEPKQFVWQNDQNHARAFADVNGHLNIRQANQTNSSEFLIYNQNNLNYGI